VHNSLRISR